MTHKIYTLCMFAALLAGCSSANVTKNPGPDDNGIRYYRPKPYLLVTPADATGRMVKLEVLQLQDYSEEYSIHPKGRKPPAVALKDGWNLVAVGGPAPPSDKPEPVPAPPADPTKLPEYVVASSNIPIGVYESVFDSNGRGGKYLKGWRYIGSSIYGGGDPNGIDPAVLAAQAAKKPGCAPGTPNGGPPLGPTGSAVQGPLYGIVFFNGAMTFRQLDEIGGNMTCPQYAKTIPDPVVPPAPPPPASGSETVPAVRKPAEPGSETVPEQKVPVKPKPNPTSFYSPKPRAFAADADVTQTSARNRDAVVKAPAPIKTAMPTRKHPDPKALAALEADVFRKLGLSNPVGTTGSTSAGSSDSSGTRSAKAAAVSGASVPSTAAFSDNSFVPDLSPAMPNR
jgi:hypothetical protein